MPTNACRRLPTRRPPMPADAYRRLSIPSEACLTLLVPQIQWSGVGDNSLFSPTDHFENSFYSGRSGSKGRRVRPFNLARRYPAYPAHWERLKSRINSRRVRGLVYKCNRWNAVCRFRFQFMNSICIFRVGKFVCLVCGV